MTTPNHAGAKRRRAKRQFLSPKFGIVVSCSSFIFYLSIFHTDWFASSSSGESLEQQINAINVPQDADRLIDLPQQHIQQKQKKYSNQEDSKDLHSVEPQKATSSLEGTSTSHLVQDAPKSTSAPKEITLQNDKGTDRKRSMGATDLSIALVTFTHLKTRDRFENLIFPMLETWYQDEPEPLYVVMTNQWKQSYQDICQAYKNRTTNDYCQRIQPIFVDCPEGGFGESPCCKQEKGLVALYDTKVVTGEKVFDYIIFCDDDMYFRMPGLRLYLTRWNARLLQEDEKEAAFVVTAGGISPKLLGQAGYKGRQSLYPCSSRTEYRYPWGQPIIYSSFALKRILSGLRAGGLVKQCLEFNVTHDAGNSIFHWMYQLPDYAIRFHMFPSTKIYGEAFGIHGIHRYIPKHNRTFTMHDVHKHVQQMGRVKFKKYLNVPHHHWGFNLTETYRLHGDPSAWGDDVWHTMPVRDCLDDDQKAAQS